ncbi:hypothetical protein KP509_1Z063300 [Ceratopteris richardii]|nr:hypothetical protein KP509_1Z063300 [Ceratopteris richardii]
MLGSRPHLLYSLHLFGAVAMPQHEPAVPKFGEWDGNEDLSYSVVFENARVDKEGFMLGLKNSIMESSLNQENYKNLHNRAQNITCRRIIEIEVKGSRLENPNLSSKHMKQGVNTQKASQSVPEFDKKF